MRKIKVECCECGNEWEIVEGELCSLSCTRCVNQNVKFIEDVLFACGHCGISFPVLANTPTSCKHSNDELVKEGSNVGAFICYSKLPKQSIIYHRDKNFFRKEYEVVDKTEVNRAEEDKVGAKLRKRELDLEEKERVLDEKMKELEEKLKQLEEKTQEKGKVKRTKI